MAEHLLDINAPSVNPTGAPGNDYEQIQASPDAFGAGIGRAEQGLGQATEQAGSTVLDAMTARLNLQNETHASEVNTWLADQITDKFSAYSKLEGKAAQDALPQFKSDIAALQQQAVAQAGNDQSRMLIQRSTAPLLDSYYRYGTNYADGQFRTWQDRTATARAATFGGQASIAASQGDFAGAEHMLGVSDDEVRKKYEQAGWDPDSISHEIAQNRGRNVANIVEQIATVGVNGSGSPNLDVAKAVFDKHRGEMDAQTQLKVEQYLAPRILNQRAQSIATGILGGGLAPDQGYRPNTGDPGPGHGRGSINAVYTGALDQPRVPGGPSPNDIYQHVIQSGVSRNEAILLTAAAGSEGVYNPEALHDKDANGNPTGYGLFGHRLERRDAMFSDAGTSKPTWQQQTDFALKELRSRPEGAMVNSATNPIELANAEVHFEKPRAYDPNDPTAAENYNGRLNTIRRIAAQAGDPDQDAAPSAGLDKSAAIQKAISLTGDNAALRDRVIANINRSYSQFNAATATERSAIGLDFPNQLSAALHGDATAQIPSDRIDALFPTAKAQAMKDQFAIAQHVGTQIAGLAYSSPDEVNDAARDVMSGQGALSNMMKAHARFPTTGPGAMGATDADDMNGAYFKLRAAAQKQFQDALTARSKMLVGSSADPAAYVMNEPGVARAAQAALKDPTKLPDYVAATLGVQAHVGVPEDQQHVFTRQQAMDMSQKLQQPGTDVRGQLQSMQKSFGSNYGKVFSDLVQMGKLPSSYQAVATIKDADDAALMARAIQQAPGTGEDGKKAETWNERVIAASGSKTAPQTIKDSVNTSTTLQSFVSTLQRQGVSAAQIDNIQRDIQTLANAKVYWSKMDPAGAADSAVTAFTKQYEFLPGGTARLPTDVAEPVKNDMATMMDALDASHIALPRGVGGHLQTSAADYIGDIRAKGSWINTPRGDGVMLLDGAGRYVTDHAGRPLTIPFSSAGHLSANTPTAREVTSDAASPLQGGM